MINKRIFFHKENIVNKMRDFYYDEIMNSYPVHLLGLDKNTSPVDPNARLDKLKDANTIFTSAKSAVVVTYADPLVLDLDGNGLDITHTKGDKLIYGSFIKRTAG